MVQMWLTLIKLSLLNVKSQKIYIHKYAYSNRFWLSERSFLNNIKIFIFSYFCFSLQTAITDSVAYKQQRCISYHSTDWNSETRCQLCAVLVRARIQVADSDDHYTYHCRQESLRRNGVAIMVHKRVQNAVTWMQSQKRQNDLCMFPRQTIQYHGNPSLCPNQ